MSHQIVFFDKNNKRQGPFTEGQVQEWYRTGWFDRGFKFSFLSQLEQLDDHTPAYSLDELIRHNGHGCPFLGPPIPSVDQREEKMDRLEKEIAEVRGVCDSILALSVRVDMIEKRIKEFTETPAPVESTTNDSPNAKVEKKDLVDAPHPASPVESTMKETLIQEMIEKRIQELTETPPPSPVQPTTKKEASGVPKRIREECEQLAGRVAASTMRAIDLLQSGDFGGWDDKRALKLAARVDAFFNKYAGNEKALQLTSKLIVEELLKQLEGRDCVQCSLCHTFAYNPRQALVHCITPDHIVAVGSGCKLPAMPGLLKLAKHIFNWGDEDNSKYLSQKGDVSRVVPTREFLLNIQIKHGVPIAYEVVREAQRSGGDLGLNHPSIIKLQLPTLIRAFKGPQGAAVIAELDAHIAGGITGCMDCGVVTGTREAYYEHVLTWVHMANAVKTFALNVHSMAINFHMRHLLKTDI